MSKKRIKRRPNGSLDLSIGGKYKETNVFSDGGMTEASGKVAKEAFSGSNLGGSIGSIGGAVGTMIDTFKKNSAIADTTGIEQGIKETNSENFEDANDIGSLLDSYNSATWQNSDYTMEGLRGSSVGSQIGNTFGAAVQGAAAGASVGGPWGAIAGAAAGLGSGIAGIFVGNKKAKEKAAELNRLADEANMRQHNAFNTQADSVNSENFQNRMANIAALGGPIFFSDGGGIHIKKKNRGKFTASAKRAGMGVQEYARHILANKEKYSPTLVKRANFARNASKWKHALGGYLFTHGGDWTNGLSTIDTGGTHEQNLYEGVPMGIAPDGQPNLVEQGEVIFNDYVFSNRLHPSEKELEKANLPKRYKGHTFALIAEDMGKESSERPNDPISKRGLEDSMMKLAMVQEAQRVRKGKKGTQQMMAFGGRKYAGNSDLDNPYNDPYIGSKEQALEEAELNYYASKSPEIQEGLRQIRGNNQASDPLPTWMRYAPVVGSAVGAIQSIFQKPDYENADILMQEARDLSRPSVRYRALNNYLTYRPLDRNYYLNQLKGQAGATRRSIMNSGSNAGNVMAGLLAADYNAQNAVGNTLMKMEEYNDAQRQKVAEFNRGTDQYNSQAAMSADAQNAQLAQNRDRLRSSLMTQAAQMREAADTTLEATRSANLTNFFDNLGGIGRENMGWNWTKYLADSGAFGQLREGVPMPGFRRGGMLTKKNRRRR